MRSVRCGGGKGWLCVMCTIRVHHYQATPASFVVIFADSLHVLGLHQAQVVG